MRRFVECRSFPALAVFVTVACSSSDDGSTGDRRDGGAVDGAEDARALDAGGADDAGDAGHRADGGGPSDAADVPDANDAGEEDAGAPSAWPIERVTVGAGGAESDANTNVIVISQTGRFAAFRSGATTISDDVPTVGLRVFLRDRQTDSTTVVNLNNDGESIGSIDNIDLSDDGTRILFESRRNLFNEEPSSAQEVFVHDTTTGTTALVSLLDDESYIVGGSQEGRISGNGRYVVFLSDGPNLPVPTGHLLVFIRDLREGTTRLVSQLDGEPSNRAALDADPSDDGRRVVFQSQATNLGAGGDGVSRQIYMADLDDETIELVSVSDSGEPVSGIAQRGRISGDGRFVAFGTSDLLVEGAPPGLYIYLRDTELDTTIIASVDENGDPITTPPFPPSISDDGRFVAFETFASGEAGDTDTQVDVYVFDRLTGTSRRVSLTSEAEDPDRPSNEPSMSGDGTTVGFLSASTNMVPEKTTLVNDGYVVEP